ncbi:Protein kinase PINOID 2 [Artemisia annua]|uniref:non-specific serine/threonine protein kinase n=1 Tax=Artemisia annua TaxID=35608 RepID=A0A2U1L2Y8_ARTAN|nr:Protein kinase PINOID 2 [Artemisia annua]
MTSIIKDDQSDYESSCSSITVPDSSRSWMSNASLSSFGSRRCSVSGDFSSHKPHKANQAGWEAIKRLRAQKGGIVSLDHFKILKRVGSGDIGNVYLCQIRNPVVGLPSCYYAMKVVDREALAIRKKLQRAEMEKEILSGLDHPFLPTLYAEFDASHYSCLVMEFCPGGDLHAARQRQPAKCFSITSAKFYAAETLLALEYLHMMGIVYRDLKPENVLVREDGHIMLSDFDLSLKCDVVPKLVRSRPNPSTQIDQDDDDHDLKCSTPSCVIPIQPVLTSCFSMRRTKNTPRTTTIIVNADNKEYTSDVKEYTTELVAEPLNARSKSFVGTHEYLAPEVISGQGHGGAVDWWTLGVFLYELLYGITPFKGENNEKTLINILKKPLSFPRIGVSSSKEYEEMVKVQDLIARLLVKNPKKRIGSLKGSNEIKKHEFFKGVNWALIRSVRPPEVPSEMMKLRNKVVVPKLMSKKERDAPFQIPNHHFDYF